MPNPISDDVEFLSGLLPFNDQGYGTGAIPMPPDPRDYLMERIPEVEAMLAAGVPASYDLLPYIKGVYDQGSVPSCFPAGTRIRMVDGSEKPIEEIQLLDSVLTAERRIGRVSALMVREQSDKLLELRLIGHRHLKMTPEHPVLTKKGYLPASEIKKDDWIALPRFAPENRASISPNEYLIKPTKAMREGRKRFTTRWGYDVEVEVNDLPREIELDYGFGQILGLFLAEGNTHRCTAQWTFGPHEAKTLAQETLNLLRSRLGLCPLLQVRPCGTVNIVLHGVHWARLLEVLCGTGAGKKRLHPDLCAGPKDFLRGVFEGWLDGDGHVSPKGRTTGVTISHDLALGMYDIAQALGLQPTINVSPPSPNRHAKTRQPRWEVTYSVKEPLNWRSDQTETHVWRRVESVVDIPLEAPIWVFNMEVEGDNSYVAEGIGVHNCVAHSTAGLKSVEDFLEHSSWNTYDAPALYTANGGTGQNGIDTRRTLQYSQDTGLVVLGGSARYRIGSYAFAPRVVGQFEDTLKAAVAANRPCVLALLLPQAFGWDSSGGMTQGYHQVCVVGYDATNVIILNSWGNWWGKNGLGRIPWSYLTQQNFQNGYVYAYTVIDALDGDLKPPVNKPPVAVPGGPYGAKVGVTIAFSGTGSSDPDGTITSYEWNFGDGTSPAVGSSPLHTYQAAGTYTVTLKVTDNGGATSTGMTTAVIGDVSPPPVNLAVEGYSDVSVMPWISSKARFNVKGTFPTVGVLQVFWKNTSLNVISRSPTTLVVDGPEVSATDSAQVKVQVEGASVFGPLLTVIGSTIPTPIPPVGELKIAATVVKLGSSNSYAAYATVSDPSGKDTAGTVATAKIGETSLGDRTLASSGAPAIWSIPNSLLSPGTVIMITAVAPDGRKGATNLVYNVRAGNFAWGESKRKKTGGEDDQGETTINWEWVSAIRPK